MGRKLIWDGEGLPEVGDEVLIHIGSSGRWEKYIVEGIKMQRSPNSVYELRIFVVVKSEDGCYGNERLLADVKPLDYRG